MKGWPYLVPFIALSAMVLGYWLTRMPLREPSSRAPRVRRFLGTYGGYALVCVLLAGRTDSWVIGIAGAAGLYALVTVAVWVGCWLAEWQTRRVIAEIERNRSLPLGRYLTPEEAAADKQRRN